MIRPFFLLALSCLFPAASKAGSWNQHLGPSRNAISPETKLLSTFAGDSPQQIWSYDIGEGWSAPVVSENRAYIFYRKDDKELLDCLDLKTGAKVWSHAYVTHYRDSFGFEEGPRGTPALNNQQIYTFGAEGKLSCLSIIDGREVWSVDCQKAFDSKNGFFGMACSPMVFGSNVVVNVGGKNAGIVSWEKMTGRVLWKATSDEASYSSAIMGQFDGQERMLVFTREGLVGLEPATGFVKFEKHWRSASHASVNAATPIVQSNKVFLTSSYDTGATLLSIAKDKVSTVWTSDESLSSHYSTPVLHHGFLYGFHGRQEQGAALRCVNFLTGKVSWEKAGFGSGTSIIADGKLLILSEQGELILAAESPTGYVENGRRQILGTGVRAHAALSDGLYLARDKRKVVCLDLRAK